MQNRRVVITGLGSISAIGKNVNETWENVVNCKPGIAPMTIPLAKELRFKNAGEVKNYEPERYFSSKELESLDKFAQFGLIAAREAVDNSGIEWNHELRRNCCIITGCSIGGQDTQDKGFQDLYLHDQSRIHLLTIPRTMPNAAVSQISMAFGITGIAYNISTACSSSNHAIGNAFWMVRNGLSETAITGGAEAPLSFGFLKAWEMLRVVSLDTCRPFSKCRQGMILGEGGAILILESLENALKRNANIYAEIIGFGSSSDASHLTKPDQRGPEVAMHHALNDAKISPDKIDYINAHGTGTFANDPMEIKAVKKVFGEHAMKLSVSSTKSLHGHVLGGTSAVEAVITVLGLQNQIYPPTANFIEADPECDLDVVPNSSRQGKMEYAMSNSFAFGGLNAALVFKKWSGE